MVASSTAEVLPSTNARAPICTGTFHAVYRVCPSLWKTLPLVGIQHVEAGDDPVSEPAYALELRNCPGCNSTLAVEVQS